MPSKKSGYNYREPDWAQKFILASANNKLSSADRSINNAMKSAVKFTPQEAASNIRTEIDPENLIALDSALQSATDPEIIKILQDEKSNVLRLVEESNRIKEEKKTQEQDSQSWLNQIGGLLQNIFTRGN